MVLDRWEKDAFYKFIKNNQENNVYFLQNRHRRRKRRRRRNDDAHRPPVPNPNIAETGTVKTSRQKGIEVVVESAAEVRIVGGRRIAALNAVENVVEVLIVDRGSTKKAVDGSRRSLNDDERSLPNESAVETPQIPIVVVGTMRIVAAAVGTSHGMTVGTESRSRRN
uniref:Uncharacterized protein n=1 Tax=Panagrellus redivivus TaxID=6233 RepID=A0A7E5A1K9_PANRE